MTELQPLSLCFAARSQPLHNSRRLGSQHLQLGSLWDVFGLDLRKHLGSKLPGTEPRTLLSSLCTPAVPVAGTSLPKAELPPKQSHKELMQSSFLITRASPAWRSIRKLCRELSYAVTLHCHITELSQPGLHTQDGSASLWWARLGTGHREENIWDHLSSDCSSSF